MGDYASVGYFDALRDLTVVDLTEENSSRIFYLRDPPDDLSMHLCGRYQHRLLTRCRMMIKSPNTLQPRSLPST